VLATKEEMHVHRVSVHQVRVNGGRLKICVSWPSENTSTHESSLLHVKVTLSLVSYASSFIWLVITLINREELSLKSGKALKM
jgi:hypothetical protein